VSSGHTIDSKPEYALLRSPSVLKEKRTENEADRWLSSLKITANKADLGSTL
jgi:hypothetical protein